MQYINVDTELFYITELNYLDILIYSHISNYYNAKNGRILFTKSKDTIANDLNVNIRSVFRSISRLKEYGFIKTRAFRGKGNRTDSVLITPIPIKDTKLYKEKYNHDVEEDNETKRIIEELKIKWRKG